jgi:hypothetical protein
VYQEKDVEGQKVILHAQVNSQAQKWKVLYLDKKAKRQTKGLNEEFGFYINRPFYIRSRLPMQRVVECVHRGNVLIRRWRKNVKSQQWKFDEANKTIINNQWNDLSLDIQGNGS